MTADAVALAGATVNPEDLGFPIGRPAAHWGAVRDSWIVLLQEKGGGRNQANRGLNEHFWRFLEHPREDCPKWDGEIGSPSSIEWV